MTTEQPTAKPGDAHMAPPSLKPKLNQIKPEAFALEVAHLVKNYATNYVDSLLAPAFELAATDKTARDTTVYKVSIGLAQYALTGTGKQKVGDHLQALLPLMTSTIGGDELTVDNLRGEADPDTKLGLVMRACLTRAAIEHGEPVSFADLATLSSLSSRQVSQLARHGDMPVTDGEVQPDAARAWLIKRGAQGFERSPAKKK
jgi:hypothetical protein